MIVSPQTRNIFDSNMQTLVNPVNARGAMGKGLALQFKDRYPDMFKQYVRECEEGMYYPGAVLLYREDPRWVLNFATKDHWRDNTQIIWIETGLHAIATNYRLWGITSLAMPKIGCGYGGLNYYKDGVRDLIHDYLDPIDISVEVYE